jgi:hypothetical protein
MCCVTLNLVTVAGIELGHKIGTFQNISLELIIDLVYFRNYLFRKIIYIGRLFIYEDYSYKKIICIKKLFA